MDLITGPPPARAVAAMAAIDGLQLVPAVLNIQRGPDGHLGPESAGAILLLQGTFADQARFEEFWGQVTELMALLATTPGFIRRYNFTEGPHYTLIALWRTVEAAHAFFGHPRHQAAMRATFERRWNYTHFAGLWQVTTPRQRLFFCQACPGISPSTEPSCTACGAPLADPFGDADVRATASVP